MGKYLSRRSFTGALASFLAAGVFGLSACSSTSATDDSNLLGSLKIGTMPTEDILPMWVAEQEDLFSANNVAAEIVVFDSAQNLSAAIIAGEVDLAMTDPMRAIKLCESGTPVIMDWITLGTDASQGRFGVLAPADAKYGTLEELADYCSNNDLSSETGVGLAANTVPEYVYDKLCEQAGVDTELIPTQEVASLPDRYSLLSSGKLLAAALPGSMLALGEANGMTLLADDSTGDNISQSVMIVRSEFNTDENASLLAAVRAAWDAAVANINANPENYRSLLVEKANLNDAVASTYPISTYPRASNVDATPAYPSADLITPQIEWMTQKGYLEKTASYNETDGSVSIS